MMEHVYNSPLCLISGCSHRKQNQQKLEMVKEKTFTTHGVFFSPVVGLQSLMAEDC